MPDKKVADAGVTDTDATVKTEAGTLLGEDGKPKAADDKPEGEPKTKTDIDEAKKAADEQAAKAKAEADAKAAMPEKYDLKLPEGTIVDEPMMAEFTAWAKENKWTNEQAQKAADLHMKSIGAFAQKQAAEFQAKVDGWRAEVVDAKDLQGSIERQGTQVSKVAAMAEDGEKVLAAFGTKEEVGRLCADLKAAGLHCHPILVRGLARFVGFVGEDSMVIGSPGSGKPTDVAHRLYPNNP